MKFTATLACVLFTFGILAICNGRSIRSAENMPGENVTTEVKKVEDMWVQFFFLETKPKIVWTEPWESTELPISGVQILFKKIRKTTKNL